MKLLMLLTTLLAVCMAGRLDRRELGTVPNTIKHWKKQCQGSCTVNDVSVGIHVRWVGTFRPNCFGNNCQDNAQALACRDAIFSRPESECSHDYWIFSGLMPWGNGACGCLSPQCSISDCTLRHNEGFLTYEALTPCSNYVCPDDSSCTHDGTTATCVCNDDGYELSSDGNSCEPTCATLLATAQSDLTTAQATITAVEGQLTAMTAEKDSAQAQLTTAQTRITELEGQLTAMTAEKDKFESRYNYVKAQEENRAVWWEQAEADHP